MKILMCPPDFYDVQYSINPWMDENISQVDKSKAKLQWGKLHETVSQFVNVDLITPIDGLPDMVFTANAAAIIDGVAHISNFKYSERSGEERYFKEYFENSGYDISLCDYSFEGAGDCLSDSNLLYCGYGKRSDMRAYNTILGAVSTYTSGIWYVVGTCKQMIPMELVDNDFYHLDTCFCPIDDKTIMWYPQAFSIESRRMISGLGKKLIEVNEEEAKMFSCNAVVIPATVDRKIQMIMPITSGRLIDILQSHDINVWQLDMSEFIKSGGACKCLTIVV